MESLAVAVHKSGPHPTQEPVTIQGVEEARSGPSPSAHGRPAAPAVVGGRSSPRIPNQGSPGGGRASIRWRHFLAPLFPAS